MTKNSEHMKNLVIEELTTMCYSSISERQRSLFNKFMDKKINAYIFDTDAALRPARQPLSLIFTRACFIKRTLGTRVAAGYLRNRKVSIEAALYLLTRKGV